MNDINEITTAKEYGNRLKRIRGIMGLSQKELGEKIGVVGATVAKWEKEGIRNIEDLQRLSIALERDLLQDEIDEEGSVGEIGKMILCYLIKLSGKTESYKLMAYLYEDYGLSRQRAIKELSKLQRIGLCERENYTDLYDTVCDMTYITAKGLILAQNNRWKVEDETLTWDDRKDDGESSVITYERVCHGYDSYQEYLDNINVNDDVLKLRPTDGFRINIINYILEHYEYSKEKSCSCRLFYGENLYEDIMNLMVRKIDRGLLDELVKELMLENEAIVANSGGRHFEEELEKSFIGNDYSLYSFVASLSDETGDSYFYDIDYFKNGLSRLYYDIDSRETLPSFYNLYYEHWNKYVMEEEGYDPDDPDGLLSDYPDYFDNPYRYIVEKKGKDYKKWFSDDEIITFIKENILPPQTPEEQETVDRIKRIIDSDSTILDYFVMPDYISPKVINALYEAYDLPKITVKVDGDDETHEMWKPLFMRSFSGLQKRSEKCAYYDDNHNIVFINLFALVSVSEINKMNDSQLVELERKRVADLIDESPNKDYIQTLINEHPCCEVKLYADNSTPI